MTHICVGKLNIIGSDNGLSPRRRQAIIWTNAGILLIRPLGTKFSEILFRNQTFSFKKMHLKMSSAKWRPFCLGLNELSPQSWSIVFWIRCARCHRFVFRRYVVSGLHIASCQSSQNNTYLCFYTRHGRLTMSYSRNATANKTQQPIKRQWWWVLH